MTFWLTEIRKNQTKGLKFRDKFFKNSTVFAFTKCKQIKKIQKFGF